MDSSAAAKMEEEDVGVPRQSSPEEVSRYSQLTTETSTRSLRSTSSSVPADVVDVREAKAAIARSHRGEQGGNEAEEPSLALEDLQRPEKGSVATATTANSSWSQLPVAQPIDVAAQESSLSLLPNSGVVPISESLIDSGGVDSIRDHLMRRASDRTNSNKTKSTSQLTGTASLTDSSGFSPSMQQMPGRPLLETTDELDADGDEEEGAYTSSAKVSVKKGDSGSGMSNTTLAIIAAMVVLVVAIVAGVCLSGQCGGTDEVPSPAPTVFVDRRTRISEYIQSISLSETLLVYPVPQSREPTNQEKALTWLLDEDPLVLQGFQHELHRVTQRFALASLWFYSSSGRAWVDTTNWLTEAHECDWANVVCTLSSQDGSRRVSKMEIAALDLAATSAYGPIPDDLALLSNSLEEVSLALNGLSGTIPTSLSKLTKLSLLDFSGNFLTGSIPSALGDLSLLRIFRAGENEFKGTLPSELGKWTDATVFTVFDNQISGTVPSELGNMRRMRFLRLENTLLSGTLPSSLSTWQNTFELFLFNTNLNGTMPFCGQDDPGFFQLVADCGEVECSCCTACCPRSNGSIPVYSKC